MMVLANLFKREKLRPYKLQLIHELNEDDFDRRAEFCEGIMERCNKNNNFAKNIHFSNEATVYLNGVTDLLRNHIIPSCRLLFSVKTGWGTITFCGKYQGLSPFNPSNSQRIKLATLTFDRLCYVVGVDEILRAYLVCNTGIKNMFILCFMKEISEQKTNKGTNAERERIEILCMIGFGDRMRTQKEVVELFNETHPDRHPISQTLK
ncbi:hypothetical protein NQ318_016383 [Aromia moschata]|uniref:Uncharacterized protein n=1 Tax=Aromia moschata TaxID=1265417 RepID=A0AAV8Z5J1_9CUCU|nr:hypothetical protein NQ318_016383 [Aromia moschata]